MLQAELKIQGLSKVGIYNLSPGMVNTELLMSGELWTGPKKHHSADKELGSQLHRLSLCTGSQAIACEAG